MEITELLLAAGASVNAVDAKGFSALHCTAQMDHPEVARRLLASGADFGKASDPGITPLALAAISGKLGWGDRSWG